MSGLSKDRFTELNQKEKSLFSCGICLEILNDPKFVICCQQLFCNHCISEWMAVSVSTNCPICRTRISHTSVSKASHLIINLIKDFKIECIFAEKGCKTICTVEQLASHEIYCDFNPIKVCKECKFVGENEHNCISELKKKNDLLENEIRKLEALDRETIKKRALDSAKQAISDGKSFVVLEEDENTAQIRSTIIEITKNCLKDFDDCLEICKNISDRLHEKYGSLNWQISLFAYGIGEDSNSFTYNDHWIVLSIGSLTIDVYAVYA